MARKFQKPEPGYVIVQDKNRYLIARPSIGDPRLLITVASFSNKDAAMEIADTLGEAPKHA